MQASRIDGAFDLAGLHIGTQFPKFGRHSHLKQIFELPLLWAQLHPIAQILAWFASVVPVFGQPFRQPHCSDVRKFQCQFPTFTNTCFVNIGNIIKYFHMFHDFTDFLFADAVCLRVEP